MDTHASFPFIRQISYEIWHLRTSRMAIAAFEVKVKEFCGPGDVWNNVEVPLMFNVFSPPSLGRTHSFSGVTQ